MSFIFLFLFLVSPTASFCSDLNITTTDRTISNTFKKEIKKAILACYKYSETKNCPCCNIDGPSFLELKKSIENYCLQYMQLFDYHKNSVTDKEKEYINNQIEEFNTEFQIRKNELYNNKLNSINSKAKKNKKREIESFFLDNRIKFLITKDCIKFINDQSTKCANDIMTFISLNNQNYLQHTKKISNLLIQADKTSGSDANQIDPIATKKNFLQLLEELKN